MTNWDALQEESFSSPDAFVPLMLTLIQMGADMVSLYGGRMPEGEEMAGICRAWLDKDADGQAGI